MRHFYAASKISDIPRMGIGSAFRLQRRRSPIEVLRDGAALLSGRCSTRLTGQGRGDCCSGGRIRDRPASETGRSRALTR